MGQPLDVKIRFTTTFRSFTWRDQAVRAWGGEFHSPDRGIYEFSNGRKFDSTDLNKVGIYNPYNELGIMIETSRYPDMVSYLEQENDGHINQDY